MIIAYTGIRNLCDESDSIVTDRVASDALAGATEMRFGGARGSDTVALEAAYRFNLGARLRVFVPFLVKDQPLEAREAILEYADEIIELGMPRSDKRSYFTRNQTMIEGSDTRTRGIPVDVLVAFKDHRDTGGTAHAIRAAEALCIPCKVLAVVSRNDPGG